MVIVHMSGGFGNQLFSYAFGYAVAKARNEELWIDTAIQDAPWFFRNPDILEMNIKYNKRISYHIGRGLLERAFTNKINFRKSIGFSTRIVYEEELKTKADPIQFCKEIKGNLYLKGNWGNESWFKPVANEVINYLQFPEPLSIQAQKIADDISADPNAVTVHVRRGDYVKIGIALTPQYFISAMRRMTEEIEHPTFYFFTEDISWVKSSMEGQPFDMKFVQYESEKKGIEDFRLLQMGKHQIISNSSYSWWAAYLNKHTEKKIIIPCMEKTMWDKDFMVAGWIPMAFELNG